jgi:hypothetical protein
MPGGTSRRYSTSDEGCWKRTNVNDKIHNDDDDDDGDDGDDDDDDGDDENSNDDASNGTAAPSTRTKTKTKTKDDDNGKEKDRVERVVSDTIKSKAKIRGRGGVLRENPTHNVGAKR